MNLVNLLGAGGALILTPWGGGRGGQGPPECSELRNSRGSLGREPEIRGFSCSQQTSRQSHQNPPLFPVWYVNVLKYAKSDLSLSRVVRGGILIGAGDGHPMTIHIDNGLVARWRAWEMPTRPTTLLVLFGSGVKFSPTKGVEAPPPPPWDPPKSLYPLGVPNSGSPPPRGRTRMGRLRWR